ncbi:hypothetical protein JRO89_XS11G0162000 [Xanthoceras sorbifolium]|uniref:Cytochrome P450 n=1 Tax=Xanthoceras sorbifolium TaxID=99658 RepID=A0ABQ8HFT5_9ROSI|nr:hypothetical protein JRO89_XS11G0162000 [Xanthoceras sorbifolium]
MVSSVISESDRLIFVSWWSWWWDGTIEIPNTRLIPTLLAITLVLAVSLYAWFIKKPFTSVPPLPPGPPGLPLLGNLPFLPPDLHRYFAKLSKIYGPIMKLQLGRKICIVITSPSVAKQVLKDHDAIFANRDPPIAAIVSTYGGIDIAWSPNGPEWRKLRKIFVRELMSKTCLDACHALRRQEVRKMVEEVYAKVGSPINIGDQMFLTVLNVIMSMSWGGLLHGEDRSRVGFQFRQVVDEIVELWGAPNISDLFPVLARFDLQGVESKMKNLSSWFDRFFESLINTRTKDHQDGGENKKEEKGSKDFLETLLELTQQGDNKSSLSMNQVKVLLLCGLALMKKEPLIAIPAAKLSVPQHHFIVRLIELRVRYYLSKSNTVVLNKEKSSIHGSSPDLVLHNPKIGASDDGCLNAPTGCIRDGMVCMSESWPNARSFELNRAWWGVGITK